MTFPLHMQGLASNHSRLMAANLQVAGVLQGVKREQRCKLCGLPRRAHGSWDQKGNGNSRGGENCSSDRAKLMAAELARQRRPEAVCTPCTSEVLGRLSRSPLPLQPTGE